LHDLKSVKLPVLHQHRLHGYHLFVIRADNRDDLRKYLYSKGVETGVHYPMALPTLKAYEHPHLNGGDFANAISYSQEIISLPLYPEMSDEDAIYISREIKNFYDQN
jgi:dTDP-4-amino-4,6-dideoxygalactose transaminase